MTTEIGIENANNLLNEHYSKKGELRLLYSYADINYLLTTEKQNYILKFNRENVIFETDILSFLNKKPPKRIVPKVIENNKGELISEISINGSKYYMRLISFIEGELLYSVSQPSVALLESFGRELAGLDLALANYSHAEQNRYLIWDAKHSLAVIEEKKRYLSNSQQELLNRHLRHFNIIALPALPKLRQQIIHNDANDQNIIVSKDASLVVGIIDFGDAVKSYLVGELANACVYIMMDRKKPLNLAITIIQAYHRVLPLQKIELEVLFEMIILRLCLSVSMSGFSRLSSGDNEYLTVSEGAAWALLEQFKDLDRRKMKNYFKDRVL